MCELKKILLDGLALSLNDRPEAALLKFKEGLRHEPRSENERIYVAMLHRMSGVIHEQLGQTLKAKRCHLKSMRYRVKADPCDYYCLGLLSQQRGELWAADRYFTRCEELAMLAKDGYDWLLEILAKGKPE
jgi:hypothetical protein